MKNRAAQELAALGHASMTAEERRARGLKASAVRWAGHKAKRPAAGRKKKALA